MHEIVELGRIGIGDCILIATTGHSGPRAPDTRAEVVAILGRDHPVLRIQLTDGRILEHACNRVVYRVAEDD